MFQELINAFARWLLVVWNPTTVNDLLDDLDALRARAENVVRVTETEIDAIDAQIARLSAKADVATVECDRAQALIDSINTTTCEV